MLILLSLEIVKIQNMFINPLDILLLEILKIISDSRMTERLFSLPLTKVGIHFGHVRMYATPYPISLIIFILDLGPSYTDKLLEFRWVQIAHHS